VLACTNSGYFSLFPRCCRKSFAEFAGNRPGPACADAAPVDLDHRSKVGSRTRHEHLVGDVQLCAIDFALHELDAKLIGRQLDDALRGDALENVVGRGRCDQLAIADHEDVFAAALGDVAVLVEHDGLIEAVRVGFRLRQGAVDVDAGDLRPGRDTGILNAPPGARVAARHLGKVGGKGVKR